MNNNDILRRLRFVFDYDDAAMIRIFANANATITLHELHHWFRKEEDDLFVSLVDKVFCQFLDGLIIEKRGLREGAEVPKPSSMNNNAIFKKLRIALEMKEQDIIDVLALADLNVSSSELGALFRNPSHKNFKACGDQMLRNFIKGLSLKYRGM
ncbi:DUF1456 family protein [Parashewanella spongiae]|uniref:DUF1456 family protein n=1 Tax=Parashewanella spongiae TaxID=342950 RepID=A0A3A6U002_9GAMM|nr:DUF1456 family protein [Parashewanella spongiae]MCL1077319.1 DUF1456 family protein [Parashewanella spongiae]RJY18594.1 DUF1456 family protein [Parashewanella spongiae]